MMQQPAHDARQPLSADAQHRLAAVLATAGPFEWGRSDCLLFVGSAVQAATGRDPVADLRGAYTNALQAMRLLLNLGGWPGLLSARFGPPLPSVFHAQCGDVLLLAGHACSATGGPQRQPLADELRLGAVAVCWRGLAVSQGAGGAVFRPLRDAYAAWGLRA